MVDIAPLLEDPLVWRVFVDANAAEAEPEPRPIEPADEPDEEQDDERLARDESEAGEGDYVDGMSE